MLEAEAIENVAALFRQLGVSDKKIANILKGAGYAMPASAGELPKGKPKTVSTEKQVEAVRPGVYRVTGVHRLYLKKTSRKTGSYFLRYRTSEGKRPEMGLGSIADVSLDKARGMAEEAANKLRQGINPANGHAVLKGVPGVLTVAQAIQLYLDAVAGSWKDAYARRNWFNPIERYALPVIGHLSVEAVHPQHILMVLAACDKAKLSATGSKIRSHLRTVFNWLGPHGYRNVDLANPCDAGMINAGRAKNGKSKTEHYRRIALDDAPEAFRKLQAAATGSTALAAWLFMTLTACRPGEALAARWDQIDLEKKLWTNPMSKTETPLTVPLSELAVTIIERLRETRKSDLVFANAGGGKLAHSNLAGAPGRAKIEAGTPHSWRSLFRDAVEDKLGWRRETAEAALGHSLGAVEGAYRRETGTEQRRVMMEAYADWLMDDSADNVVALQRRA